MFTHKLASISFMPLASYLISARLAEGIFALIVNIGFSPP